MSTLVTDHDSASDGRRRRAERNRAAVVDAILALLREGKVQPGAAEIAERAGVSLRSVFRHFDDLDALTAAALQRHQLTVAPLFELTVPVGPRAGRPAPRDERIEVLAAQRNRLYGEIAPVRAAAERQRDISPAIAEGLERARRVQRRQLGELFAPELDRLSSADRRRVLVDLELVTSFSAWHHLRTEQSLSAPKAREAMARLVRACLA